MSTLEISQFPGMYRLDPVQSSQRCNRDIMIESAGFLCAAKPIKDSHLADIESSLFGISDDIVSPNPIPLPVPRDVDYVPSPDTPKGFLQPLVKYHMPQRGQSIDRFIIDYPVKKNLEPFDLYVGVNSRQMFKM